MDTVARSIIFSIEKLVSKGMTPEEALDAVGAKKLDDDNNYCVPYGENKENALIFKIKYL